MCRTIRDTLSVFDAKIATKSPRSGAGNARRGRDFFVLSFRKAEMRRETDGAGRYAGSTRSAQDADAAGGKDVARSLRLRRSGDRRIDGGKRITQVERFIFGAGQVVIRQDAHTDDAGERGEKIGDLPDLARILPRHKRNADLNPLMQRIEQAQILQDPLVRQPAEAAVQVAVDRLDIDEKGVGKTDDLAQICLGHGKTGVHRRVHARIVQRCEQLAAEIRL